jgi:hypothetical protein
LDGGLSLNSGNIATIGDGVTFGSSTFTTVSNNGAIDFNSTNGSMFNTELIFGSTGGSIDFENLTLGSNALVHGVKGQIGSGFGDTLNNQGTIDSDAQGGSLSIDSTGFINTGTVKAENGGTLTIAATNWINAGTLITSSGGTIYLGGTLNNTGSTFDALNTVGGTHNAILTGTISGGQLLNSNALNIQGGMLTNIVLDGGLTLANGYAALIGNGVTFGSATPTTVTNNSTLIFNEANWTLTQPISTSSGGTIYLVGTLDNTGSTFDALNTIGGTHNAILVGTLTGGHLVNSDALNIGTFANSGTLTNIILDGGLTQSNGYGAIIGNDVIFGSATPTTVTNNSTLTFSGANWTLTQPISTGSGGTIYLGGTLNNTGSTFDALNTIGGTHNAILTGTISGGTLLNSSSLNIQNGTLTNITLDGGLTVNKTFINATIGNGVTFGTATPTTVTNYGALYFNATNWTLPGLLSTDGGTIYLGGTLNNTGSTFDALYSIGGTHDDVLIGTMTGGTLLNSSSLNIQNGTLTNITLDGGLTVNNFGTTTYIGNGVTFGTTTPTTVNGSMLSFNGSSNPTFNTELLLGGTLLFNNLTLTLGSNALVHGNPLVYGSGTIGSGNGDTLLNQGTIDADVSGRIFYIDSASFTNEGLLEAHGGSLIVNSDLVLAGGALYVTPGNTVSANASVTQTGGNTRVDGTLNTTTDLQLKGGELVGTGTINGNLNNTGGTVRPGDLLGTLTINGNYTQAVGGITQINLGGTQAGVTSLLLNVTGLASLGGELDVKLTGGFVPTVGETFDFLNYGSLSGAYDSLVSLDNGYGYTVSYGNGMGILTVSTIAAVPETSTLLMAGLMLCAGGLLLRRRERRQ